MANSELKTLKIKYDQLAKRLEEIKSALQEIIDTGVDTSTDGGMNFIRECLEKCSKAQEINSEEIKRVGFFDEQY